MNCIRIMIVEDDIGWLKSMTSFLNKEEEFVIAGTACDKSEAVKIGMKVFSHLPFTVCFMEFEV